MKIAQTTWKLSCCTSYNNAEDSNRQKEKQ